MNKMPMIRILITPRLGGDGGKKIPPEYRRDHLYGWVSKYGK
jgi:hypothetical protein